MIQEIKDKAKEKVKEGFEKASDVVGKGLDAAAQKERAQAEKDVQKELRVTEDSPQKESLQERLKSLYTATGAQISEIAEYGADEINKQIHRIENVAFKHQMYHVDQNYQPVFSVDDPDPDDNGAVHLTKITYEGQVRGIIIKKFVFDNKEIQTDKLNNILASMYDVGTTLAVALHRTPSECTLCFLLKANIDMDTKKYVNEAITSINSALKGNFPGTQTIYMKPATTQPNIFAAIPELNDGKNISNQIIVKEGYLSSAKRDNQETSDYSVSDFIEELFNYDKANSVSIVTGIPSSKSHDSKFINQGIEKILDGARPKTKSDTYTIFLLAEPLAPEDVAMIRNGYEQMASLLTPYQNFQYNFTRNVTNSNNLSKHENLAKQVTNSTNYSVGIGAHANASASANAGLNSNEQTNISHSKMDQKNKNHTDSVGVSISAKESVKAKIPGVAEAGIDITEAVNYAHAYQRGEAHADTRTIGNGFSKGYSTNANAGATAGVNLNVGMNKTVNSGRTYSTGFTFGESITDGQSISEIRTFNSVSIENIIERIKKEVKRMSDGESSGMWRFACYVLSGNRAMSERVAHMYQGLIQGEDSSVERSAVNTWTSGYEDRKINGIDIQINDYNAIITSLLNLQHPMFTLHESEVDNSALPSNVYCATELNGAELALALNLPQKSLPGLPVIKCAPFGREIQKNKYSEHNNLIEIGKVYHMQEEDKHLSVDLDVNELSAHTFITGSTGSGKTNTVCKILERLSEFKGVKFLIVEPAKGEYKDKFGGRDDVSVYGTNPNLTPMLRINPFSFPTKSIHILEHLDRLVEIFNVCWPMYAAMPVILKEAIERAYEEAGWDLVKSENKYNLFPSFYDVCRHIEQVVAESAYSADNKSDYIGALVTRIRSLTNGLNGIIFSNDEISNEDLFEKNVIVDLSRVGSTETKSLIMGMLVLKLQEHRMDQGIPNNTSLKHITVLEEAHNLLKRTSTEQISESSNLLGKSVEMLANSIAEMRAYGEGFVIADQSPGLLDMSVIRNTNTKIIMRLPDLSDRELVGKAAGLNDDQIVELGKLETGVAAVMQSGWLEAVLCKVNEYDSQHYQYQKSNTAIPNTVESVIIDSLIKRNLTHIFDRPDGQILKANIPVKVKVKLLNHKPDNDVRKSACEIAYELFDGYKLNDVFCQHLTTERKKQLIIQNIKKAKPEIQPKDSNRIMSYIFGWHYEVTQNAEALNIANQYIETVQ